MARSRDDSAAGEALARERALLDFAVAHSPTTFYIADAFGDQAVNFISANVETNTGFRPEHFVGQSDFGRSRLHPDDRQTYAASRDRLSTDGRVTRTYRFQTADGSYRWFRDEVMLSRREPDQDEEIVGWMTDITEVVEGERERERLSQRLEDAIETLPSAFSISDAEGRLVMCNSAFAEFYGQKPADMGGWTRSQVLRTALPNIRSFNGRQVSGAETDYDAIRAAMDTDEMASVEFEMSDGTWWLTSRRRTADGGIVSVRTDITAQKQAERRLHRAREALEDAIESLSEGFALWNQDDELITCNSRYRDFHSAGAEHLVPGVAWTEVMRKGLDQGHFTDAVGREDDWLHDRIQMRRELMTNLEYEQSDGRWVSGSNRRTRQGGIVVTLNDITERKQMETALRTSENLVRRVLEACPLPVAMNRLETGEYIYLSPANVEMFGYDADEGLDHSRDLYSAPDMRGAYVTKLRESGRVDDYEVEYRRADGTTFPAALSSRVIEYQGEDVIVSTVTDLTERRAAEVEIERQRTMLHQAEKLSALGELLAGISHELNNPLTVLLGQAQMLKEKATDEQTAKRAERISAAAGRCSRIVKSFLALAHQNPREPVEVDLNDIVDEALELTAHALRTAGIDVSLRLAGGLPRVMGDPDQLRQVFTNLIINAHHAMEDVDGDRVLTLKTAYRPKDDQVVATVTDNGPGVPSEIRSRIFDPLFTTKEVGKGTGIGLSLCHRIMQAHDGTIKLASASSGGTTFALGMPRRATSPAAETEARTALPAEAGKLSILIVADAPDMGVGLADILIQDGHGAEVFGSGVAGLERLKQRHYDAIFCDARPAGSNAQQFCRSMQAARPGSVERLAFITDPSLTQRDLAMLDATGRPFIESPFRSDQVRELVDLLLRRPVR